MPGNYFPPRRGIERGGLKGEERVNDAFRSSVKSYEGSDVVAIEFLLRRKGQPFEFRDD